MGPTRFVSNGLITGGNNKQFPTKGRQQLHTLDWQGSGSCSRLGIAWKTHMFHNKL